MRGQVLECALNRPLYYARRMRRAVAEACDVLPLKVRPLFDQFLTAI